MKRLLTLLLVMLVCFGCIAFVSCGDGNTDTNTDTDAAPSNIDNAVEYVFSIYNSGLGDAAAKLEKDLTVIASVIIENDTFNVEWSVEVTKGAADAITVVDGANNTKTIDIPDYNDEQIEFTLKATVKGADGETGDVSFKYYIPVRVKQEIDSSSKVVLKFMDGDTVKYITGKHYLYTSSSGSQKWELELTDKLAEALAITVVENADNTISFVAEGKYLFCDATNVKFVDTQDDNTKFVLEPTSDGNFIKCAVANYNGKAQYLEGYKGYLTCYGMNAENTAIYTFSFVDADNTVAGTIVIPGNTDKPGDNTGDDNKPTTTKPVLEAVAPVVGTAYKLGFVQGNVNKAYYLTGVMSSYYMATSENFTDGVDFFVEETDGGYYLYCMIGTAKKYVNIVAVTGTDGKEHVNALYEDAASTVYTYNETLKTVATKINDVDYVIGTRSDKEYNTLGPIKADSNGFVAVFVTKAATDVEVEDGTGDDDNTGSGTTVSGTTYDFSTLENGEQYVYDERDLDDIVKMMLTECHLNNGQIRIYNTISDQYGNHDGYAIFASTKVITAVGVNAGNNEDNLLVYASVDGVTYELVATFAVVKDYNDNAIELDASKGYKYIKLDAENKQIRVKTLTLAFSDGTTGGDNTGDDNTGDDNTGDDVVDTNDSYIFGMTQANCDNKIYYLAGGMSGFYMATTEDANAALKVYLEAADGGYYFYCYVGETKTYINMVVSGTHVNGAYEATASTVYTLDAEKNTLIAEVDGVPYWFGTRNDNTYTTMGPCKTEYNGFYGVLYPVTAGDDNTGDDNTGDNTGDDNTGDDNTGDDTVKTYTIPEALELAADTELIVSGTVTGIYQAWDEGYGNISVYLSDDAGNQILCFRLATKVGVGDVITVTGKISVYNEVNQVVNGTAVIDVAHVCSEYTDATCENLAKCVVCGATTGNLAEHTMVSGTCSVCGYVEGEAADIELTISFADKANRTEYDTSKQVWEQNGITVTNNKGASTSNVGDYANPARFYKSSQIIVAVEGKSITKIVFNCSSSSYATALQASLSANGATISVDGSDVTVKFASAVDSYTIESLTGGQVRINNIVVYCK